MKNFLLLFLAAFSLQAFGSEVTVYSVYSQEVLGPTVAPFTEQTGIKVNIVNYSSADILKKLEEEGENTAADIHLDKDIVYLGKGTRAGFYRSIESKVIDKNVPSDFFESKKNWFVMLYRSRLIIYNKNVVNPAELSTYEDLTAAKWKGRLCLRTSQKSYNQALGAYMIAHHGMRGAKAIFSGWAKNLAEAPLNSDKDVIRAVNAGRCDVAIVNHYYLAPFIKENPDYAVRPFFPNQKTTKAHVNGIGVALVKHSKNVAAATKLMEYFSRKDWQSPVAAGFNQYPVSKGASVSPVLRSFGSFERDETNIGVISNLTEVARKLMLKAGYK